MSSSFDLSETSSFSYYSKFLADLMMIFIPSVGYYFQAMKFKQTKSTKGFAKFLCLLLLIANILRIFFWFGKKFALSLLYQAIVVIISQIYLIHYYLKYRENTKKEKITEVSLYEHITNWKETLTPSKVWLIL